ncbi:MAG TPA: hypothetical protein DCY97_19110 [Marinilabiliales bacterium]|nr:hypothetical protein [Marinilabiliales bacterium]
MITSRKLWIGSLLAATMVVLAFSPKQNQHPELDQLWAQITEYEEQNLPKSALEVAQKIYALAMNKGLDAEAIKALMHQLKFTRQLEPNSLPTFIELFKKELNHFKAPSKQILQSMLAEMYQTYYEQHRWEINDRTPIGSTTEKPIEEWDGRKFHQTIAQYYLASLEQNEAWKGIPIQTYLSIIEEGDSPEARPTVYDFLLNRCLIYFEKADEFVQEGGEAFILNEQEAFADARTFCNIQFQVAEPNLKSQTLKLYQEWLTFRLKYEDQCEALLRADLQRLNFVNQYSSRLDKDSLYLTALNRLQTQYADSQLLAEIYYQKAEFYNTRQFYFKHQEPSTYDYRDYLKLAHTNYKLAMNLSENGRLNHVCKEKIGSIEKPELSFESEATVIPNQMFPALLTFANVDTVYVKVGQISLSDLEKNERRYNYHEYYKSLSSVAKPVHSEFMVLPVISNFRSYRTELLLKPLETGNYLISMSNHPTFDPDSGIVVFQVVQASNLAYIQHDNHGNQEFFLCNRTDGKPLANAKADVFLKGYNYRKGTDINRKISELSTDPQGRVTVTNQTKKEERGFVLQFYWKGDTLNTNNYYTYQPYRETTQTRLDWFTDRAIYRPGQVVYFKGILTGTDSKSSIPKLIKKRDFVVAIWDANGQEIKKLTVITNDYGSFSGSLIIPKGSLNGQWYLQTPFGSKNIRVEEYKRPGFQVALDSLNGAYKLDQKVQATGNATAYNGMAITSAQVKWRVTRLLKYHWWWMPMQQEQPIAFGETVTSPNGAFAFDFMAWSGKVHPKPADEFYFRIEATVTDPSGESQTTTENLVLGGRAIKLILDVPEKTDAKNPKPWSIATVNASGKKTPSKVQIRVQKLETPTKPLLERKWDRPDTLIYNTHVYEQVFEDFNFNNNNYYQLLPVVKGSAKEQTLESDGSLEYVPENFKKWEPGIYRVEFQTNDPFNNPISEVRFVTVYDPSSKKVAVPQIHWAQHQNQRLEPGSQAWLEIGTSEKVWILYQVEHNGKILHSESFPLEQTIKKLKWAVSDSLRGGFAMHVAFVYQGRLFQQIQKVEVPFNDKELKISYKTFRDKLQPGAKETWTLKLEGLKGELVAAEMLASMYDASLDQFAPNPWNLNLYPNYYYSAFWNGPDFGTDASKKISERNNYGYFYYQPGFDRLNWFQDLGANEVFFMVEDDESVPVMIRGVASKSMLKEEGLAEVVVVQNDEVDMKLKGDETDKKEKTPQLLRTNFSETAFFYPHLYSDSSGTITFNFTVPDNLTRYKFQALAHTTDLEVGLSQQEVVAQKELMVQAQAPRFVTQGDRILFPCKVQNLTNQMQEVTVSLKLSNPITGADYQLVCIDTPNSKIKVAAKQSQTLFWELQIPDTLSALQYTVTAQNQQFSDGEQKWIPVLSNKILVTETQPLWINGTDSKGFELKGLLQSPEQKNVTHHQVTLEFTANPSWYAIMALPYLMKTENKCTDQIFTNLYANQLASFVVQKNPQIGQVFEQWKSLGLERPFTSVLEQNHELKQVILSETPWVLDALNEQEQKQQLAHLFDANQMNNRLRESLYQLQNLQHDNGAWPWFDGMPDSRFVTQHLATGFGKLIQIDALTENDPEIMRMVTKAIQYLDREMVKEYHEFLKEKTTPQLDASIAQYLYMRSFFPRVEAEEESQQAQQYFLNLASTQWAKLGKYSQGMIALAFYRQGNKLVANAIVRSLREYSLQNEELGMYWSDNVSGYYWYQAPIEFQSLMLEVFHEIAPDAETENNLKKWLLKNKQTHQWHTSKATSDAVYSLLTTGSQWVAGTPRVDFSLGKETITNQQYQQQAEPFSGYLKKSWDVSRVTADMGKINVQRSGDGISWGAVYWQYFEEIGNVKTATGGLFLSKEYYKKEATQKGLQLVAISENQNLKVSDRLTIRLVIETDRDMEFVHLKDNRASAFEPTSILSGYRYQEGLGFYQVTHDCSTDFFIDYLPKGKYVLEYDLMVTHSGLVSSGLATVQCMYAPGFSAHSSGTKLNIKP